GKPEEAETNRGSFRLDEDGRAVAQTKTSWISASGLDVHAGSGDLQLSSHADADSEVCLKGAQRPELHASGRNQNKYQTPRTRESATKRAGPCSIEIFQHPASPEEDPSLDLLVRYWWPLRKPLMKDPVRGRTVVRPRRGRLVQLTVMATTLDWVIEPDVPVTVKLTTCEAGVVGLLFEVLPHPRANSEMRSSSPSTLVNRTLLRVSGFRLRIAKTVPNSPRPGRTAMPITW